MGRRERPTDLDAAHVRIRDRILAATLDLIDTEGSGALTVRRMAAAADRSSMCVYSTFGNRAVLVGDAWSQSAEALEAAVEARGAEGYRAWAVAHPLRYAFVWEADASALELDPERRRELLRRLDARLDGSWAALHGEVVAERVLAGAVRGEGVPSVAG